MESPLRAKRLQDLIESPLIEAPSWVAPAVVPKRGVVIFAGATKIGKTFMTLELTRALATGGEFLEYGAFRAEETKVMVVEREVGEFTLNARSRKVFSGTHRDKIYDNAFYISQDPDLNLDNAAGLNILADEIDKTGVNVLILDPISHMHTGDENDNSAMNEVFYNLEKLRKLFKHRDFTIIVAHHFRKPPEGRGRDDWDPLDINNIRGAGKFSSAPDTIITLNRLRPNLNTPWESWQNEVRYTLRHGESPPDQIVSVNRLGDLRVRWEANKGENRQPPKVKLGEKLKFSPASFTADVALVVPGRSS